MSHTHQQESTRQRFHQVFLALIASQPQDDDPTFCVVRVHPPLDHRVFGDPSYEHHYHYYVTVGCVSYDYDLDLIDQGCIFLVFRDSISHYSVALWDPLDGQVKPNKLRKKTKDAIRKLSAKLALL